MSKKEMTLVYYHVPQDKDDPDCPNVFGVPYNKTNLRLSHIYEAFPLKGTYLFRFKYYSQGQLVWLDLPDLEAKLPTYKEKIYVKATRVSWNDSKLHSNYKDRPKNIAVQTNSKNIDFFENSNPQPKKDEVKPSIAPVNSQSNRIDFLNQKVNPSQQPRNQQNLLQEMHLPKNEAPSQSYGLDFLGNSPAASTKKAEINLMQGFDKHGDLI